jgi:hypothetical protein
MAFSLIVVDEMGADHEKSELPSMERVLSSLVADHTQSAQNDVIDFWN